VLQGVVLKREALYTNAKDVDNLIADGREWNFHDADTGEHLHGLHPYPAKFIPQIPRKAIGLWTKPGDLVYDPFCGCGTTLLEARLMGRPSIGVDNNAVACLVSKAKTAIYSASDIERATKFLATLDRKLATIKPRKDLIPKNENFLYWFSVPVLERLSGIKSLVLRQPEPLRTLFLAAFSSIIVRVSYQDSDTRYAKIERVVRPENVDTAFASKVANVVGRLPAVGVRSKAVRVSVHQTDSRDVGFIPESSVSLIVTSPPYLNAYDYHKYHRQRLHWIDGDVEFARKIEIGTHDEFTRPGATPDSYFEDMDACFAEWERVLRPRGRCLVVIGDAIVSKKAVRVADTFIDLMERRGMPLEKHWIRELHATSRTFNVRNSRITHEHVLLFRKEARTVIR
jgi:site-specific DNA-methyltransferase (cytosine-N4-specific)